MSTEKRPSTDNDTEVLSTREKLDHFYELIDGIEIAMLTTFDSESALVSRPMATQDHAANGGLWFMTNIETHKLDDISADARVNLAYYKDRTREFVSVSGLARITQDRARIRELYQPDWRMWLGDEGGLRDGGMDDPRIALIEVTPHSATYLKIDRPQPVVLFNLLKGLITGESPHLGETGKLDRSELAQGKAAVSRLA